MVDDTSSVGLISMIHQQQSHLSTSVVGSPCHDNSESYFGHISSGPPPFPGQQWPLLLPRGFQFQSYTTTIISFITPIVVISSTVFYYMVAPCLFLCNTNFLKCNLFKFYLPIFCWRIATSYIVNTSKNKYLDITVMFYMIPVKQGIEQSIQQEIEQVLKLSKPVLNFCQNA